MESLVTKGIVIRAHDYSEKDKIISIFSRDLGKITAILKGVKKITAKMKFASQPFCYAEFTLTGKSDIYTVAGASEVDNFFDITQSYTKMVVGSAIIEMVDKVSIIREPNELLFDNLERALNVLTNTDTEPDVLLMRFALGVFKISGYQMNIKTCQTCNKNLLNDKVIYDLNSGEFSCINCPLERGIDISPRIVEILQKISKLNLDELGGIVLNEDEAQEFRQIVKVYFQIHVGSELKSLHTTFK